MIFDLVGIYSVFEILKQVQDDASNIDKPPLKSHAEFISASNKTYWFA